MSSSGTGKEVDPRCTECRRLQQPCGLRCICARYFPRGEFAGVEKVYGAMAVFRTPPSI